MYTGITPKYRRWTVGAVDCYNRHCICAGCPTYELIGKQCQMKYAVIKLVEQFGKPNEGNELNDLTTQRLKDLKNERIETMYDNDLKLEYAKMYCSLIDAVKKGYENYDDLEKNTGMNKKTISVYFDNFFKALEAQGLIKRTEKPKKQAVIDWIQSKLCDANFVDLDESSSSAVSQTIDYKAEFERLTNENNKLKEKITELENRPDTVIDFSEAKQRIKNEIERLNGQLKAIETVENFYIK